MKSRRIPITEEQDSQTDMKDRNKTQEHDAHSGEKSETLSSVRERVEDAGEDTEKTIEILEEHIRDLERENETLRDQRLRAVADLDNARRRAQNDVLNAVDYANEDLLRQLLPIIDDFDRSITNAPNDAEKDSFFQGIVMIKRKIEKLLDDIGVKRIEAVGKPFDVEYHEAMMRQPSDEPEGTVLSELEPGYRYKDRVLRHTKVVVAGE
jgi:molecular chaperone GrpE